MPEMNHAAGDKSHGHVDRLNVLFANIYVRDTPLKTLVLLLCLGVS